MPSFVQQRAVADRNATPVDCVLRCPGRRATGTRRGSDSFRPALLAAPRRWPRPADVRWPAPDWRPGGAVPRRRPRRSAVVTDTSRGLPSVSVPVLSITSVSTLSMISSASAFLISTPAVAPRPVPTMIDIGRGQPQRAGAGDDQHGHGAEQGGGQSRLGTDDRPDDERDHGGGHDRRHEIGGRHVGDPLDGRSASLGLADHPRRSGPAASRCPPARPAS